MRSCSGTANTDGTSASGTDEGRGSAPLRGSSTAVPGKRAVPHVVSGPWPRGVAGTGEPFENAGYAGVIGGGVVPPLPLIKASSVSPMGNILLSGVGGGMPGLGGGAYVVTGEPDLTVVTCRGVYASLESGLELSSVLLLAPGAPVGTRKGCRERGDGAPSLDGIVNRLLPATGFDWSCWSTRYVEMRGVEVGNGDGGSGRTSLSV
jgi:hypothetical protein